MDTKDRAILNVLLEDGQASYRTIAKKAGVSVGTAIHRTRRLRANGIIRKHTIALDFEKAGFDIPVLVDVRTSHGKEAEVERRLAAHPNVLAVYDVTGDFDIMLVARFAKREELDTFIKDLQAQPHVERTHTKLILNVVRDTPLPFTQSLPTGRRART